MKTFRATLKHDYGKFNILITAESEQSARAKICIAENCPPIAIVKIKEVKTSLQKSK